MSSARAIERARRLLAAGEREAGLEALLAVLEQDPQNAEAARELALAWSAAGDPDQAEYFCRLALAVTPESAEMHLLLGNLLREAGRYDEALECALQAVRSDPASAPARNNLGNAYKDLGRLPEAVECFREALRIDDRMWEAHYSLAIALRESGAPHLAEEHYRAAVERNPRFAQGWLDLGLSHYMRGDLDGAMAHYDRAIAEQPDFAEAHVSRALQRLSMGDFEAGWQEYEWRLQLDYRKRNAPFAGRPRWQGGDIAGKRLLLYGEQGFGDTLQFFRYAPLAAARGAQVWVACLPDLKVLLARTPGVAGVVAYDEPLPEFDLCQSLLSLPLVFGTTLRSVPAKTPYVFADPEKVHAWENRLSADGATRVGLVWSSGPKSTRSTSLAMLSPLAAIPGLSLYSLQRGEPRAEIQASGMRIADCAEHLRDFSDNAALLANLDLLISVDTSVAHLAGAMGAPVWTLHNEPADWRWLLGREDSPWYPSMRLFRARRPGGWDEVISRAGAALAGFVRDRVPKPGCG